MKTNRPKHFKMKFPQLLVVLISLCFSTTAANVKILKRSADEKFQIKTGLSNGRVTTMMFSREKANAVTEEEFWLTHTKEFGIHRDNAIIRKAHSIQASGWTIKHYDTVYYNRKVYGGSLIVSLDSHGNIFRASGHTLPADKVPTPKMVDKKGTAMPSISLAEAHEVVARRISTYYAEISVDQLNERETTTEIVWLRSDVAKGGLGQVTLCYMVTGAVDISHSSIDLSRLDALASKSRLVEGLARKKPDQTYLRYEAFGECVSRCTHLML
jgi:hypothetical protein